MRRLLLATALCATVLVPSAFALDGGEAAVAEMKDRDGKAVGTITLSATASGVVLKGDLGQLAPGAHGFHIHEIGKCEPPFSSAGGHWNPAGKKHGFHAAAGPHAGDLPNLHVAPDGKATLDTFVSGMSLTGGANSVLDADGAALVIHAKVDDYTTDPAGDSGDRIVCGVITKRP
jgi:Cu-Zn family superoxide dismutase